MLKFLTRKEITILIKHVFSIIFSNSFKGGEGGEGENVRRRWCRGKRNFFLSQKGKKAKLHINVSGFMDHIWKIS